MHHTVLVRDREWDSARLQRVTREGSSTLSAQAGLPSVECELASSFSTTQTELPDLP